MAKPTKQGPSLFDLLAEHDSGDGDSISASGLQPAGQGHRDSGPVRKKSAVPGRRQDSQRRDDAPVAAAEVDRRPFLELDGATIRISATSWTAALVVFGAVTVLVFSFELGRQRGVREGFVRGFEHRLDADDAEGAGVLETVRRGPPRTDIIESLLVGVPHSSNGQLAGGQLTDGKPAGGARDGALASGDVAAAGGADGRSLWIRSRTYIIVQEFMPGRASDAAAARRFLADAGIDTELIRKARGAMQLITAKGFDRSDPEQRIQSDALLERVRQVGEAFARAGGGYKLDGYLATFTGERW